MTREKMGSRLARLPILFLSIAGAMSACGSSYTDAPEHADAGSLADAEAESSSDTGTGAQSEAGAIDSALGTACAQPNFKTDFETDLTGWTLETSGGSALVEIAKGTAKSGAAALLISVPDSAATGQAFLQRDLDPTNDCLTVSLDLQLKQITKAGLTFFVVRFANKNDLVSSIATNANGAFLTVAEQSSAAVYHQLGQTASISLNVWHSLLVSYGPGPTYKVKLDGLELALAAPTLLVDKPTLLGIGEVVAATNTSQQMFVDNVSIE